MNCFRTRTLELVLAAAALSLPLQAVVIDYVPVGNPANPADPATGYGAVPYSYQMGTYEVTNSQYAEFLNAVAKTDTYGLYNANMSTAVRGGIVRSGLAGSYVYTVKANMEDKPVNYTNAYDAARFANWLHHAQPTGLQTTATTEGGAYSLTGNTGSIVRNSSATVWIPTENEWYKAAYYDPTAGAGGGDHYWNYPTGSDLQPTLATSDETGLVTNPGDNVANYDKGVIWNGQVGHVITVGSAGSTSYYGTFDQGGNLWEWNEAIVDSLQGIRGGSWTLTSADVLVATNRIGLHPTSDSPVTGFRVATVPEPQLPALIVLFGSGWLGLRRRAARSSPSTGGSQDGHLV